ncbi:MAG: phenylalanine--tRNA ligase subunit beta [Gammaproteobacteria bacterium 28-57-27]|nr:MAG: phenylalanine--tRNA ligase subunit beta [Gammaproteobacteria bacterium 28-57-27]
MRFSEQWLREWVNPALSSEQLGAQLTMAGLELDALEPAAPAFSGVFVAKILEAVQHPDADKLRVCQVDDGTGTPVQVVCGAPNARAGLLAAFARVGAQLPGGLNIGQAKLRGVESFGMLCGASELGLDGYNDGLLELPADAPVGSDVRSYLKLDDQIFELGITPNRGDCLSILGLARETAAQNDMALGGPELVVVPAASEASITVTVSAPAACPRYCVRVIEDLNAEAVTPLWLTENLRRSGLRPIHPIVDVANYVMLELGQPLHAFDLDRLHGSLEVRMAKADENMVGLDGKTLKLEPDMLVIADSSGPVAMAGVIGGQDSGVKTGTTRIVLESAYFTPEAIAGRARRFGLHTDAAHRFERGTDPELPRIAIERASELICSLYGGIPGVVSEYLSHEHMPQRAPILLRRARIERILGFTVEDQAVEGILQRLGILLEPIAEDLAEGWRATPPSHRHDLSIEVDLIEELARLHGYDQLPARLPSAPLSIAARPENRLDVNALKERMVSLGYREVISYSFVDAPLLEKLTPDQTPLILANPISSEMAAMRTTLWAGLISTLKYNLNRQQTRARLFETGLRFVPQPTGLKQEAMFAGLVFGDERAEQWGGKSRKVDFFDLKGDIEALLALGDLTSQVAWQRATHPALHPGVSARLLLDGEELGWAGVLHPSLEKALDLPGQVFVFELHQERLLRRRVPRFQPVSRFPIIRRDLALLVSDQVSSAELLNCVHDTAPAFLREAEVFDVYRGQGVPDTFASIAIRLILQDNERTLGEADVDAFITAVLTRLNTQFGITLRT